MAFAQITYRESLRDIEVCLSAQSAKLYHMGSRGPIRRSTLADANETRDWRIYAEFGQRLIAQARRLYAAGDLDVDLPSTVYALDSTTIDLCLSMFPWAHFRSTKAAVKMHTLLDLCDNIPSLIHISDGKLYDVHVLGILLPEPGAIYIMDRGYVDFARLQVLNEAGAFFVASGEVEYGCPPGLFAPADRSPGVISDQTIAMDGYLTQRHYPAYLRRILLKNPEARDWQDADLPHQSGNAAGFDNLRPLQEPLAGGTFLQVDQAASAHQAVLWHLGERGEDPDLDRGVGRGAQVALI